jgi:hypothetical protein
VGNTERRGGQDGDEEKEEATEATEATETTETKEEAEGVALVVVKVQNTMPEAGTREGGQIGGRGGAGTVEGSVS